MDHVAQNISGFKTADHRRGRTMAQACDSVYVSYGCFTDQPLAEAFTEAIVRAEGRPDELANYLKAFKPSTNG